MWKRYQQRLFRLWKRELRVEVVERRKNRELLKGLLQLLPELMKMLGRCWKQLWGEQMALMLWRGRTGTRSVG
jgi:hypothetical protein